MMADDDPRRAGSGRHGSEIETLLRRIERQIEQRVRARRREAEAVGATRPRDFDRTGVTIGGGG
jgi:hypothetical protein